MLWIKGYVLVERMRSSLEEMTAVMVLPVPTQRKNITTIPSLREPATEGQK